jgi:hypothetical protein
MARSRVNLALTLNQHQPTHEYEHNWMVNLNGY